MMESVFYGTPFEEPDDERAGTSRPLRIDEQTVKDERGRRRFHGAFTGGFSAGYFNSVGSKEGWQPKQFRSSRDARGERIQMEPEDFMDEEDFGEYGIATRKLTTSAKVGKARREQNLLAWERNAQSSFDAALSNQIEDLLRLSSDSVGTRILKKMGWKEGQGIGPQMTRRALERQAVNEKRSEGKTHAYNKEAVEEADEMAPDFLFSPEDVDISRSKSSEGFHGLGYRGFKTTTVLSENSITVEAALKLQTKSKGVSGQAFGVGAFEDDDDSVYTNYDLSQYDFAVDNTDTSDLQCSSGDTSFVVATERQQLRQFFEPPRITPHFHPVHKPLFPNLTKMPETIRRFSAKMNHVQRAKFFGEVDKSAVLEVVKDHDREMFLMESASKRNKDALEAAFEEEPMKQARFIEFISYLKRGLDFPKPPEVTLLEWEQELNDFQKMLPSNLKRMLSNVKSQQQPLASLEIAAPIASVLKAKFVPSGTQWCSETISSADERRAAVKLNMFGDRTHLIYDWHPAKQLAKLFNVPEPYPSSSEVGAPALQKAVKTESLSNLGTTAQELEYRAVQQRDDNVQNEEQPGKVNKTTSEGENADEINFDFEKPPEDLFHAIFGDSGESDIENEEEETADDVKAETMKEGAVISEVIADVDRNEKEIATAVQKKFITVMDVLLSDEEEFGPALPPMGPASSENASRAQMDEQYVEEDRERSRKRKRKHSAERLLKAKDRSKKRSKERKRSKESHDRRRNKDREKNSSNRKK